MCSDLLEDGVEVEIKILLKVFSLRTWFKDQREDRKFVSTLSRIMSGHCTGKRYETGGRMG
jgi:hypothetical protein